MTVDTGKRADVAFEPDVVLPVQFFATVRRQAPAKRGECQLMIAVLEDAVHCFQKYALARDRQGRRLFREAEEWMMDDAQRAAAPRGEELTLSFKYVCDVLGLDPAYLRGGLRRWREQLAGVHRGGRHSPSAVERSAA